MVIILKLSLSLFLCIYTEESKYRLNWELHLLSPRESDVSPAVVAETWGLTHSFIQTVCWAPALSESNVTKMIALPTPRVFQRGGETIAQLRGCTQPGRGKRGERMGYWGQISGNEKVSARRIHTKETYKLISLSKVLMYLIKREKGHFRTRKSKCFLNEASKLPFSCRRIDAFKLNARHRIFLEERKLNPNASATLSCKTVSAIGQYDLKPPVH